MVCYFFLFIIPIISIGILKVCLILTRWNRSPTCLIGKTAIVTGANSGIGYYTALDFAKRGARVIITCRNKEKAEVTKTNIIEETGNPNVFAGIVEFSSLSSVRHFVKQIKATEDRLDILVNNAGAEGFEKETSADGLNLLMQINYFGPTLLTLLLIDLLKKSAPSRIVNVSSIAAKNGKLNLNDINANPDSRFLNYSNSKLCNILFTNELARRLKNVGVTVNSLHPGFVRTNILKTLPLISSAIMKIVMCFGLSAEEGAQTSIYVSVSQDIKGVTGEYFDNCQIARWFPMPKIVKDQETAKTVWEMTEKIIKLTDEEKQLLYI